MGERCRVNLGLGGLTNLGILKQKSIQGVPVDLKFNKKLREGMTGKDLFSGTHRTVGAAEEKTRGF